MIKQRSTPVRLVVIVVMVLSLVAVVTEPAAAKREPPPFPRAQQVRELVWKHREDVLARIDAILSGKQSAESYAQVEPAPDESTGEVSEPEGAETEDAEGGDEEADEAGGEEAEGAEVEDGETQDESAEGDETEVEELPHAGIGRPRGATSTGAGLVVLFGTIAVIGLRRFRRIV